MEYYLSYKKYCIQCIEIQVLADCLYVCYLDLHLCICILKGLIEINIHNAFCF